MGVASEVKHLPLRLADVHVDELWPFHAQKVDGTFRGHCLCHKGFARACTVPPIWTVSVECCRLCSRSQATHVASRRGALLIMSAYLWVSRVHGT